MRQLTLAEPSEAKIDSEYGQIMFSDWLQLERQRIEQNGCETFIKSFSDGTKYLMLGKCDCEIDSY